MGRRVNGVIVLLYSRLGGGIEVLMARECCGPCGLLGLPCQLP